ncbi:uncharacterized protein LOC141904068 [Tubulanus polymorphus]|uniref:uncharacterized protein LOC141904068 n=1 Tax=Tubulanus polymorphus TaxID=672921 RepID=UPI003DA527B1
MPALPFGSKLSDSDILSKLYDFDDQIIVGDVKFNAETLSVAPRPFSRISIFETIDVNSVKLKSLNSFILDKAQLLEKKRHNVALKKAFDDLQRFWRDQDNARCLSDGLKRVKCKRDLQVLLSVHLFGKLKLCALIAEKHAGFKCCCGCGRSPSLGKTCIGSADTWHGELDILIKDDLSEVSVLCETNPNSDSPENNRTNIEEKFACNFIADCNEQASAQAITFGFVEKNRHCERLGFPFSRTFLITEDKIKLIMYDSRSDVLISTEELNLIPVPNGLEETAVIVWLFLNLHLFVVSLNSDILSGFTPCGFRSAANRGGGIGFFESIKFYSSEVRAVGGFKFPVECIGKKRLLFSQKNPSK